MWQNIRLMNTISNICFVLVFLIAVSAGCIWQIQRPVYALKAIKVCAIGDETLQHVSSLTIKNTSAISTISGNFFTISLDDVKVAFEAVPWVRQANVRREWPDKLVVSLEEHQPLGTWGNQGQLISTKGELFTVNMAEAEEGYDLLTFDGPQGTEKMVLQRYHTLCDQLAPLGLKPKGVVLSDRYAWTVTLNNDIRVEFGTETQDDSIDTLVKRFIDAYPQLVEKWPNTIETIDMRYQNGLAVALKKNGAVANTQN